MTSHIDHNWMVCHQYGFFDGSSIDITEQMTSHIDHNWMVSHQYGSNGVLWDYPFEKKTSHIDHIWMVSRQCESYSVFSGHLFEKRTSHIEHNGMVCHQFSHFFLERFLRTSWPTTIASDDVLHNNCTRAMFGWKLSTKDAFNRIIFDRDGNVLAVHLSNVGGLL